MVDADEEISSTLKREFTEEAINSLREEEKEETLKDIQNLFKSGKVVIFHWICCFLLNFGIPQGLNFARSNFREFPLFPRNDLSQRKYVIQGGAKKTFESL